MAAGNTENDGASQAVRCACSGGPKRQDNRLHTRDGDGSAAARESRALFDQVEYGEATPLIRGVPRVLRDRFCFGLNRIAPLDSVQRAALVDRALALAGPEAGLLRPYRAALLARLPPVQPRLASAVAEYDQLVTDGRPPYLASAHRDAFWTPVDKMQGGFSVASTPAFDLPYLGDLQDALGDLVNGLSPLELIRLVLYLFAYRCNGGLPAAAEVAPAVVLAAYRVGLAPFWGLELMSGRPSWRTYAGGRIEIQVAGVNQVPGRYIDDLLIALDVIYTNLGALQSYEWRGYPMGEAIRSAFLAEDGYARTTIKFEDQGGFGQMNYPRHMILRRNSWVMWEIPGPDEGPTLRDGNFRDGFDAGRGDCAPFRLRQLIVTLVHEMVHRVFHQRAIGSSGPECDGPSFWNTGGAGTNHYFCEWLASDFVDRIWPPALRQADDDTAGDGAVTPSDYNFLSAKRFSACRCTSTAERRQAYGGGTPQMGDALCKKPE